MMILLRSGVTVLLIILVDLGGCNRNDVRVGLNYQIH